MSGANPDCPRGARGRFLPGPRLRAGLRYYQDGGRMPLPAGHRRCTACRQFKPESDFHRHAKNGFQTACKPCSASRFAHYQKQNRERHLQRLAKDPEYFRRFKLQSMYGITVEQYDAMLAAQGGLCAICRKPEVRKLRGRVARLVVDHCHATGKVRSLLCHRCNTAIGWLEPDAAAWRAEAEKYLETHRGQA